VSGPDRVVVMPAGDPIYSVWTWRRDSQTLARLRPVLEQLEAIRDEPCVLGGECSNLGMTCMPCAVRRIKVELFGEPEQADSSS
jgi:hypothetical protein